MDVKQLWQTIQKTMKATGSLEDQTAVHRKKFEFMFLQLRKLIQELNEKIPSIEDSDENRAIFSNIYNKIHDLYDLLSNNTLQTWSDSTINYPCNYVLKQLISIATEIFTNVKQIDPEIAKNIEPESPEWDAKNILDLKAIHASFSQFLTLDKIDQVFAQKVVSRLDSIDKELEKSHIEYSTDFSPIPSHYKNWVVDYNDFDKIKEIGGGVSAVVYYGKDKRTGQEVAIKKFKFRKLNGSRLQSFQREVAVLATANHPAILKLVGVTDKLPFCIIMEWMPNHSLYHDLHVYHHLDSTGRTIAIFDIARGMQFLHSRQIVHRDLKSLNILLDANDRIRICDFGFSRHASDITLMQQNIGTPHWMAPEVLKHNSHYTYKIDVYAFGILAWEIATTKVPYAGMDSQTIIQQVLNNDIRPQLPSDLSPAVRDLITMCWERDPNMRPTFDEIVKRLSTGEVLLNGANQEQFMEYVSSTAINQEQLSRSIKITLDKIGKGEIQVSTGLKKLRENGIPSELLEEAWDLIKKLKYEDVPEFASLFFGTCKTAEAAALLDRYKPGEVPQSVSAMLVEEFPTDDPQTDENIVSVACKNGSADLCAVYAKDPRHISLALDVAATLGVDVTLKTAVEDCCVRSLSSNEDYLIASAVRCLISLGCANRVHKPCLQSMLQGGNMQLRSLAFIAMAASKRNEVDLIAHSMHDWIFDRCAALHVLSVADEESISQMIIQDMKTRNEPLSVLEIRAILRIISKNNSNNILKELINSRGFSTSSSPEVEKAINVIKTRLSI